MVRKTKTTKTTKKAVKPAAAEPVSEPVSEPVAAAAAAAAPVAEPTTPSVVLVEQTGQFMAKLQGVSAQFSALRSEFRTLERQWTRELKAAQKSAMKRKRKTGNRSPSGFVKPTLISNELAAFLGKPEGSEMARTEVTREINTYIRANKLQDKDNGRKINPDKKLSTLLKLKKSDELTYFNLQRYMSPHFAKANKPLPAGT